MPCPFSKVESVWMLSPAGTISFENMQNVARIIGAKELGCSESSVLAVKRSRTERRWFFLARAPEKR